MADARPGFPTAAVDWLLGPSRLRVLDLGAGTGKLTEPIVAAGHDVMALEPDPAMLRLLAARLPAAQPIQARAQAIPFPAGSVDVVTCGQAFHWFDDADTLAELTRVLRPGGVLAMAWNYPDTVVPWVRRFARALYGDDQRAAANQTYDPTEALTASGLFGEVEHTSYRHWQELTREGLRQLAGSHSVVATLPAADRDTVLEAIDEVYRSAARPPEPIRLPYITRAYRTRVTPLANYRRDRG